MLKTSVIDPLIRSALREDVGSKDITTSALIPKSLTVKADLQFEEHGVLCGIEVAERVFRLTDEDVRFLPVAKDGEMIEKGREIAYIEGPASSILVAERTAINFLSHLSGIATITRQFVDSIKGTPAKILDTRKTTPNFRSLEKYAVQSGGGVNHRFGLYDQILIKDNHLRVLQKEPIARIVARARRAALKTMSVGIEAANLKEFSEALKTDVDYILLDNMNVGDVKKAVEERNRTKGKVQLEVSGGITLDNVLGYAQTGVERISIGRLTREAPSIDISLDIVSSA